MNKMKAIHLLLTASFILFTTFSFGQCDPPLAICKDVTIILDSTGNYALTTSEVDNGSTADCGLQSITIDSGSFDCDDVDPVLQPVGDFQFEFGETSPGEIDNAGTIVVGSNGHIYLADINQEVIMHYDGAGNFQGTIGTQGYGVGQFANLRGIDVDASGNFYGTDDNREKVLVFDNIGSFLFEFGALGTAVGQFQNAWRVSVNASGIYVLDNSRKKVIVFDGGGNFLFEFGSTGANPGDFDVPNDITHDGSGNIYILDAQRRKVIKFNATGGFLSEFGQGPSGGITEGRFDIVEGLAIGVDNNIYVADRSSGLNNNKIMVYDNTGSFIYEFGNSGTTNGKLKNLYSVDVDVNDRLFVSDILRDNVLVFDQALVGNMVTLTVTDINGATSCCSAEVTVLAGSGCADITLIPDPNFEQKLIDLSIDSDGVINGQMFTADAAGVTVLDVSNLSISDLAGIEAFVTLSWLYCNNNTISSLDISSNLNLGRLWCHSNSLTSLDVSNNLNLEVLICSDNLLGTLDVSNNVSLDFLQCSNTGLNTLDVSNNIDLQIFHCAANSITNMDLSTNINLVVLNTAGNPISALDVSNNVLLQTLWCWDNGLSTIDVSNNPALVDFRFFSNNISNIDLTPCPNLKVFYAYNNSISNLDLISNINLKYINVSQNNLTSLDIRNGNNTNVSEFNTLGNISLDCISVDDPAYSNSSSIWNTSIDAGVIFSADCTDDDGDGYTVGAGDCNDDDPDINPGATETCNGIDDNCNGLADEDLGTYVGSMFITSQAQLNQIGSYSYIDGLIDIRGADITDLTSLSCLKEVKHLHIETCPNLLSLQGIENIEKIHGLLTIAVNDNLTSISEFTSLDSVGWYIYLRQNMQVETISFPALRKIEGTVQAMDIRAHDLLTTVSFPLLEQANNLVRFRLNSKLDSFYLPELDTLGTLIFDINGAKNIDDLSTIQTISNDFILDRCQQINSLSAFDQTNVEGDITISDNITLSSLGQFFSNVTFLGNVEISSNDILLTLIGMEDVDEINGNLKIQFNNDLFDCCSIAEMLDDGGVAGTIAISDNPQFCSTENEIISFCLDDDGDGFTVNDGDCDDTNFAINPDATETCNGIDDNCNGLVDLDDPGLVDNIPPTFTGSLPPNISTDCSNIPDPAIVSFTDNCEASLKFSQSSDWDGTCSNYTVTRIWSVTDVGGNENSHVQQISVNDTQAPVFTSNIPVDTSVTTGNVPPAPPITAMDNCSSGNHHYMEFDPIDASNATLVLTGTLDDVNVIWSLEGVTTSQYKFRDIFTSNSLTTFSNASYFTPASAGLDGAGFNAISGTATIRISFDQPVVDPVLHINNIDISRWDFSQTTDNISYISGNDQFSLEDATVVDVDPSTSGGLNSGLGSIIFHGSFSELVATITLVDVTTDGLFLQLSKADNSVDVIFEEQSTLGSCPNEEVITRTWQATDGCGLMTTHAQTINVLTSGDVNIEDVLLPNDPEALGDNIAVEGTYSDSCDLDNHFATWIWGDGTSSSGSVDQNDNSVTGSHLYDSTGVYVVQLIVENGIGSSDTLQATAYVVIYNSDGGFVTGGGWIESPPGAYIPDPELTGKANFGFVSKYKKGANVPTGNTQFKFNAASFKFKSTSYDWLVIAGSKAKYKGEGKVNNEGNYGFMLTGVDGDVNGGGGVDKFRIKIWDKDQNDLVIYDNKLGSDDSGYDSQELGGGSVTIHSNQGNNNFRPDLSTRGNSNKNNELSLFPNPTSGNIQVEWETNGKYLALQVVDMNGKLVHQIENIAGVEGPQVLKWNANHLSEGVYFIILVTADTVITKKFILMNK